MSTFATKDKRRVVPLIRRVQSSRFGYVGPKQKTMQTQIHNILRSKSARGSNPVRSPLQFRRNVLKNRSKIAQAVVAVAQRAQLQPFRSGLLSLSRAARAVRSNNYYYDPKSIIIIEAIVKAPVNGHFSLNDAQAVATYQQKKAGLGVDGIVGQNTLDVMVPELAGTGDHSEAINLVLAYYNVNLQEVLSIRYDPNIVGTSTNFESGYLQVIRIGPQAFSNATGLSRMLSPIRCQ